MSEPLVSAAWHRVASLRPSLVTGLRIVRQPVRGQVWHVLVEPASGRQVRLNPAAYALVARFDGQSEVAQVWERQLAVHRAEAATQDEVLRLLAQLFRGGMVRFDAAPHLSLLFARRAEDGQQRRKGMLNPLALRIPLLDPGPLLQQLAPLARALFHPVTFVLWCVALALAGLAAGAHWGELVPEARRVMATPTTYLIAWICYPLVKLVHELGHGMAVRRYGGEVHELGVSLMFLTPAPYVDASAANAFASPLQRLVVSAAGIVIELALAALALGLWMLVGPGVVRDTALVVLLICSVSTLLFNANPLMRMDGYYALCDALQLPNLALRSQAWWGRQWRRLIGESRVGPSPVLADGETKWLVGYAPASLLYRVLLLLSLVFWVGHESWLLGWLAAAAFATWSARGVWKWASGGEGGGTLQRRRSLQAAAGLAAVLLILLLAVPAPNQVVARGVIWPPDNAQVRAGAAGFVERLEQPEGARVHSGDSLLVLQDPVLVATRERVLSQRSGLLAQQYSALLTQPAKAAEVAEDLDRNAAELVRAEQMLGEMDVRAQAEGQVVWARPQDLPGSFVKRGAMLGHVLSGEPAHVRLALLEDDFLRMRGQVRGVEVQLADAPGVVHSGSLSASTPGATMELPTPALGERNGGPVPMDPADASGLRTRVPVFLLDATVPGVPGTAVGGRTWVKLTLPPKPLGQQWLAQLRQLLIKQFNPTGQA